MIRRLGHVRDEEREKTSTRPYSRVLAHLEGDGFLQHIKQELELQQRRGVSRVGGQRQEPVLSGPGQQVLLKHPGELLQAERCQGQRAAAVQH